MKANPTATLVLALAAALTVGQATSVRASDEYSFDNAGYHLLNGRWMSLSPMIGAGASELGDPDADLNPQMVGLRYSERKGYITGTFFAILNTVAAAMAASAPIAQTSYVSGGYIYTTTYYRSDAETQRMLDDASEASAAMMSADDQAFDLEIYSNSLPGGGEVSGYKLNMFFGLSLDERVILDVGLGFGSADSRFKRDAKQAKIHHSYFGIPFRLNVAAGPLLMHLGFDWNLNGLVEDDVPDSAGTPGHVVNSYGSPLELGAKTALFERLMLEAAVTMASGEFGYRAAVGLRF